MTHIRFLVPFSFFLACFFVALVVVYYLNAEIERVDAEIRAISAPSNVEQRRRSELATVTHNLIHETASAVDPSVMPATQREAHADELFELSRHFSVADNHYRTIATFKAQHPVTLFGRSPLPVDEQITLARQLLTEIQGTVNTSFAAARNVIGSAIDRNRGEIDARIRDIGSALNDVETAGRQGQRHSLTAIAAMGEAFDRAAAATQALIRLLSYVERDGEVEPIPLLCSSPTARAAVRLLGLLVANGIEAMQRPLDESGKFIIDDTSEVAIRALTRDLGNDIRRHRFSPVYLAGVTLEEVVDNQDLLLDMLMLQNLALAEHLMVVLGVRHPAYSRDFQASATQQIANSKQNRVRAIQRLRDDFNAIRQREAMRAETLRSNSHQLGQQLSVEAQSAFQRMLNEAEAHKMQLEQDRERLRRMFVRYRVDGVPRGSVALTRQDSDGRIELIDQASNYYHIDLGRNDNIRPGMRFLVMGERAGERYAKGMLEVVNIINDNFSACRLIQSLDDDEPIYQGDPILNRFYYKGRFLRVALVGEFRTGVSAFSRERLERYLEEMGCEVQAVADVNTELVILAESSDKLLPVIPEIEEYLDLRGKIAMDEVLVEEVEPYFFDR